MEFEKLLGDNCNGKQKSWHIKVLVDDTSPVIQTTYGYVGNKQQVITKRITHGKNKGKTNETTALKQAIKDATSMWQDKLASGYTTQTNEPQAPNTPSSRKTTHLHVAAPMLAHNYLDHKAHVEFPCYVQRKYDGVRCVCIPNEGLYSRAKKAFQGLGHILQNVNDYYATRDACMLDGELYSDDLSFQDLLSLIKSEDPSVDKTPIKYVVYDVVNTNASFDERFVQYVTREDNRDLNELDHVLIAETYVCFEETEVDEFLHEFISEGYEGLMVRNIHAPYKHSRSHDLQKYKLFKDDEYEIVNYKEGTGTDAGCVVWVCRTPCGKQFSCKPQGTREDRTAMYTSAALHIGKRLCVKYQDLTDNQVPRFPVGLYIRDD